MTEPADKPRLFDLRDQLIARLASLPGFQTVGISKHRSKPVFIVSVDPQRFSGGAPARFAGYQVLVREFGIPIAYGAVAGGSHGSATVRCREA